MSTHAPYVLFGLLTATVAFAFVAKRLALPYPIAFVIGGAVLALIPGLPPLAIEPDWIFLIVLPPLLWASAWGTDWTEFRRNARSISLLAIGLVIFTTVAVAFAAHAVMPSLPWASAFVLGAIVSPPDAVAAAATFERFSLPRRIMTILEGEGLLNDASALVIYKFAVAAVVTGTFSAFGAGLSFVWVALGGVAVGLALGAFVVQTAKLLGRHQGSDSLLDNVVLLVAPYVAYLSAEAIGVSGVLATVAAGIFVSRNSSRIYSAETRLVGYSTWTVLTFMTNAFVFLAIGLELRSAAEDGLLVAHTWLACLAITGVVIVTRIVWCYPATYFPRWISKRTREREPAPTIAGVFIVAWSGMRGIVSLAAALALPLHTAAGGAFPFRNEIILVTFSVIFATLVGQGLSLIPLLPLLNVRDTAGSARETDVRVAALEAGITRIHELEPTFKSTADWEISGRLLAEYEYRIEHLRRHGDSEAEMPEGLRFDHQLQAEALRAERAAIFKLRESGEIPDDIYRNVEYDLDLAESRLT